MTRDIFLQTRARLLAARGSGDVVAAGREQAGKPVAYALIGRTEMNPCSAIGRSYGLRTMQYSAPA